MAAAMEEAAKAQKQIEEAKKYA